MSYSYEKPDPAYFAKRRTPGTLTSMMYAYKECESMSTNPPNQTRSNIAVVQPFSSFTFNNNVMMRPPQLRNPFPECVPGGSNHSFGISPATATPRPQRFSSWTNQRQRSQSPRILEPQKENNPQLRAQLTVPNSPFLQTRQRALSVDTVDLCNSFQQNNIQAQVSSSTPKRVTSIHSLQINGLDQNHQQKLQKQFKSLEAMTVESQYPAAPSIPLFQTKAFLINPIQVAESIFDEHEGEKVVKKLMLFNCDFKEELQAHYESFKVEIRLTQLNKVTKKMEKYCIPTKIIINNNNVLSLLNFKLNPQLNPTIVVPLTMIENGTNIIWSEWNAVDLPQDSELYFSVALVQKLTDNDMLAVVLRRPSIDKSTTINMIKGVIERSVSDGVMENGSSMEVSLVCPLAKSRIVSPSRATTCTHYSCFDVEAFLQMAKVLSNWKCPICYNQINYDDIRIDEFFEDIIRSSDKNTQRVQINSKGDWEVPISIEKVNVEENGVDFTKKKAEDSIISVDEDEDLVMLTPMKFSTTATKKNLARQSVEIIFEKPVKRFKPNN